MWRQVLMKVTKLKLVTEGALTQYDQCPYRKRGFRYRQTHTHGNHVQ